MNKLNKFVNNYKKFAPVVLRYGLVFVFLWFGTSQLRNQTMWTYLVPSWATAFGLSAVTIVKLNGAFEVLFGILLLVGWHIRIVAGLLFLHLLVIASSLGFSPIGVRDIGLSLATLSIALHGADIFSYDKEPSFFS
jgi:uncharacterized membrane protein YphA (DoxX/SURF4 family)